MPAVVLIGVTVALFTGSVAQAVPVTPYDMPFPCGQAWTGSTRADHSPSIRSIDWNRPDDAGDAVVAAAAGIVTTATTTSSSGYGHYVVIDHGNGESTVYAHMEKVLVTTGQRVDRGTMIGTVGDTGHSFGEHLHFEERLNKTVVAASFAGVPYVYGDLTSFNCVDVPVAGDFTGDGTSEVAVYRRGKKSSFVVNDPAGERVLMFGAATDEPVVGDWDGDGSINLGIRRTTRSKFRLQSPTGVVKVGYGVSSDRPIAGDWDGDGRDEIGVYRPSAGTFFERLSNGTSASVLLGDADDLPVTGDWDGNGISDLGVFDQATATFSLRLVGPDSQAMLTQVQLGVAGDLPVIGDWDGDGISDLGVWTPATATFTQGIAVLPVTSALSRWLPAAVAPRPEVTEVRFGLPRG